MQMKVEAGMPKVDEVVMFDVRAVSRFFASPKAGRKCSFSVPAIQVIRRLHLDYVIYTISTSHAWCIRLGYSICSSWWTSILCQHCPQKGSNLSVLEELVTRKVESWFWVCACAHLCKLHTLVPLFLLMLAAVDMCSKLSWEWELVLAVAFNPV